MYILSMSLETLIFLHLTSLDGCRSPSRTSFSPILQPISSEYLRQLRRVVALDMRPHISIPPPDVAEEVIEKDIL